MAWFVYMLRCKDDTLYTGITTELERRLAEHNSGKGAKYTKARRPVELIWAERRDDRSEASKREARLKSLSRSRKLETIRSAAYSSLERFKTADPTSARFIKEI